MKEELLAAYRSLPPDKQRVIREKIEYFAEEESRKRRVRLVVDAQHLYRNQGEYDRAKRRAYAGEEFDLPKGDTR